MSLAEEPHCRAFGDTQVLVRRSLLECVFQRAGGISKAQWQNVFGRAKVQLTRRLGPDGGPLSGFAVALSSRSSRGRQQAVCEGSEQAGLGPSEE